MGNGAERWLVDELRGRASLAGARDGWRYATLDALLLDVGRVFTPAEWPDGPPPGDLGRCYVESVSWAWAADADLAYVEGWALDGVGPFRVAHAWCAGADGKALDPTWPRLGAAYVGLPVRADAAKNLMFEHGPLLHGRDDMISRLAEQWMRTGVPADVLVDVGRPIPPA